jgi:hypothetical protein
MAIPYSDRACRNASSSGAAQNAALIGPVLDQRRDLHTVALAADYI